ncbi:MAG: SDR family NAD(P)-dependent oxidoreductase [Planctomycetes bacterium]|nr:SDR family NAD(P)-dependent oxidoreductase [Planctomycetota bacterium]
MFDMTNRVAVVTGASSGLGVTFAKALARQGADIVLMARRFEMMQEVAKEIEALGRKCLPIKCDITDTADIRKAIDEIKKQFKQVHILVNNAGVVEVDPSEKHQDDKWNKVIDTDLSGVFKCAREFADKFMIPQKYGRIINISSVYGFVGNNSGPLGAVGFNFAPNIGYHAAKGGVVNMTRALGAEWARHNITVNGIAPGYFASGFSDSIVPEFQQVIDNYCPMGRLGNVKELESAIVYFAAEETSYTTGTTLLIDGGWTSI